ncbi:hypothetical protein NITGR_1040039 [Nitrospina gracilis 3/211]|uniref:Uncharacterized protein n=1 Tax=Nitrospina gracilis (strain 3/211) TaxID=1266370 RepID=M1YG41_NITG3|nr:MULTISPECIES: hypothetical protein [Nitrospina]MCF8722224.1 hypothetical protein [Nitrospina sp. Nb-3]CCQ89421.1 hypothetical protein NITGR_1040039 [Nitrospina gracilis 3/211]
MSTSNMEFSPIMFIIMGIAFVFISYFMGMMIHSAWMYEDSPKLPRNSKKAWILCMAAGAGVTGWMFAYGYYVNF